MSLLAKSKFKIHPATSSYHSLDLVESDKK